ncbi:MAG: serpin family protein [Myxococcota bacterium]
MLRLNWITTGTLLLGLTACPSTDEESDPLPEQDPTTTGDPQPEPAEQCGERSAPDATPEELGINTRADLEVATALLGELSDEDDNVLLSPYSLRVAFGQVLAGTQGASHPEIEAALGFGELGDRTHAVLNSVTQQLETRNFAGTEEQPELIVRPINRSFFDVVYESSVADTWLETVQSFYGTCIEVFDMNADQAATLDHVNGWVADQTNDLIPSLVKSLPEVAALIVVNALYFKASWAEAFEESLTQDETFTTRAGESVSVEMMHAPLHAGSYSEAEGWQAVSLPYSDGRLEMLVILPTAGTEAEFAASLGADALEAVVDGLEPSTVDLRLPKFDLMSTWALRPALESLGMQAPFENEDFEGIASGMMPIFQVFHDVAIAIDEKGTEAAAATAVVFGEDGTGEDPVADATVVVDHTFYLVIRDREAGAVMFFARVGDPTAS